MRVSYLLIAFLLLWVNFSCEKDELLTVECDGSSPTYDADISLIIQQNCVQCHGSGSSNGSFTTFAGISTVTSNGKFEQEVLNNQTMPQNGTLSQDQLNKIKCWVENGFPEN
ncbi:MAG: cytochrome c [Crocinitomicaceae bacterium]|nr:cytochrome c [Crocinitomicaceae bacterium]